MVWLWPSASPEAGVATEESQGTAPLPPEADQEKFTKAWYETTYEGGGQWRQLWEAKYFFLCILLAVLVVAYTGILLVSNLLGWFLNSNAPAGPLLLWTLGVGCLIWWIVSNLPLFASSSWGLERR